MTDQHAIKDRIDTLCSRVLSHGQTVGSVALEENLLHLQQAISDYIDAIELNPPDLGVDVVDHADLADIFG